MTPNVDDMPDVCTLPAADRPVRRAEFDALFATLVRSDRTGPGHLRLVLGAPVDVVRDLTARESECCSFFRFTVSPGPSGAVLDIEVPPVRVSILEAMAARLPRVS
jgi:hypothetical protein